jgi:hypothetical protein
MMARLQRSTSAPSPRKQLASWIERYDPAIARLARAVLKRMEQRLPGATELVYDNYNALVVGFGPNERASDCPFSIAVYARWVNLYFLEGSLLSDPEGLLKGSGNRLRHITLRQEQDFDVPGVQALISQALNVADLPMPSRAKRRAIVIKSVSAKQRSRRPAPSRPRAGTVR